MSFSENPNNNSKNYIERSIKGDTINLPEGPMYDEKGKKTSENFPSLQGKQSMLHSLSVIHYNDMFEQGANLSNDSFNVKESRYFNGKIAKGYRNPTGSNIVSAFDETQVNHAMQYKWGDFLFVDDYGKVPNNHLITLRRFPQPSNDNLLNNLQNPNRDVARLLTYIDGESNAFDSVFSFSAGFNWKEFQSEIQTMNKSQTGFGKLDFLGYADTSGSFAKEKLRGKAETDFDPYSSHAANYTFGPIDVIDKIMTRDRGINFTQDITLKFRYAVRSYDGITTKVAFLDIIGNMLNMVTNKAPFWGGAVRFTGGGGFSGPLGNSKMLKNGDLAGFGKSLYEDIKKKLSKPFEGGLMAGIKTITGNIGASMLGGGIDKLGRPELYSLHSLLTANPTGEWHLTIGNPFNPAMMYGNLIMEDASFSMEGPFTADDIPSYVNLEVKLKHALPRDKYAIERMFNFGGSRFYGSSTDFENKSYYRNRDSNSSGVKGNNVALKMMNQAESAAVTLASSGRYQSPNAGKATA